MVRNNVCVCVCVCVRPMLIALSQADWLELKLDGYFILFIFFFILPWGREREERKRKIDR